MRCRSRERVGPDISRPNLSRTVLPTMSEPYPAKITGRKDSPHEFVERPTVEPSDGRELDDVQAAFAGLDLGHERLRPPEGARDVSLGEPRVETGTTKAAQEALVLGGMHRTHGKAALARDRIVGWRILRSAREYPKMGYS